MHYFVCSSGYLLYLAALFQHKKIDWTEHWQWVPEVIHSRSLHRVKLNCQIKTFPSLKILFCSFGVQNIWLQRLTILPSAARERCSVTSSQPRPCDKDITDLPVWAHSERGFELLEKDSGMVTATILQVTGGLLRSGDWWGYLSHFRTILCRVRRTRSCNITRTS